MSPYDKALANPTYKQVKKGFTSHVEVLNLKFDTHKASFEDLVKFFFTFHDPTTKNKQGADKGTQYHSTIFFHSSKQKQVAMRVIGEVQDLMFDKLIPSNTFKGFKVMT
mmetsp:Transcript_16360/g.27663  ORF Transcript_16360/g.27663 Transcript_16360/m.27663 type:complete len:109 (+) Transcript_16360:398-724(+)